MNKRLLFSLLIICSAVHSMAQNYGNEWIDYSSSRRYLKIPIAKTGVFKIDFNTLNFATQLVGTSLSSIDPRSIQLFARGSEQYIYVEGEDDGVFNAGDFIEFYAEHNDGWLDESLYPSSSEHTNPYYSLYNDTIYYFLTWDPTGVASTFRFDDVSYGTPPSTPLAYYIEEQNKLYSQGYHAGKSIDGSDVSVSQYLGGKGWTSNRSGYNGTSTSPSIAIDLGATNIYSGNDAPLVKLDFGITSANNGSGATLAHHIKLQQISGTSTTLTLEDYLRPKYFYSQESFTLPATNVSSTTQFRLISESDGSLVSAFADYFKVAYFNVSYPKTPSFSGQSEKRMVIPASGQARFFNVTGFTTSPIDYVYDLGSHKRIEVQHNTSSGNVKFTIASGVERAFYLASNSAISSVSSQEIKAAGNNGVFPNLDLDLDSAYLFVTHPSLMTEVQKYEDYRDNEYNTLVLDVSDLYEQFAYGVNKHPSAIRNFVEMAVNDWPSQPRFLFLVGKSVAEAEFRGKTNVANNVLVPTMGYPASDVLITAGLGQVLAHAMGVPTGRLAAKTPAEVALYLQKVKLQENTQIGISAAYTIDNKLWQKRILHFAGGDDSDENKDFRGYLQGYADFATSSMMGAQRILFSKTSGNVIEQLDVDSVRDLIKEGVAIMTFFGHGSGNNFDISVDNPSDWGNEGLGRFPMVIANSCFSGNIHRPSASPSISEEYVLTPNEGSIGFMATPDLSFESQLNDYTNRFYRLLSRDNYGESVAEQMQRVTMEMGTDERSSGVALEMTLHGDPAIHVFPHERPEITINDPVYGPAVRFEPELITTDLDSFDVIVTLTNLGHSVTEDFTISVSRFFKCSNTTADEVAYKTLNALHFQDEVRFTFAVNSDEAVGQNCFDIEVDLPSSLINEFNDFANNQISNYQTTISSSDIFPVYPYNYAVVPDFDVTLRSNTGLPFLDENSYKIEIDTTDLYNSAWKKDTVISQAGAVISWNPRLDRSAFEDSTVFFWRVAPQDDTTKFREHSFQVIQEKNGWGQDHFYQYKNNEFDFLSYDRSSRQITFDSVARDLFVYCLANPSIVNNDAYLANNRYSLDGQDAPLGEVGVAPGGNPSILIAVIDSVDLKPWGTYGLQNSRLVNEDHQFGNSNNYNINNSRGRRVEYWFSFQVKSDSGLYHAADMIQNHVPNGNYILMYSSVKGLFSNTTYWKNEHYELFEALGADSIRYVPNNNPYIFLAKKGYPSTAIEVIGQNSTDNIQLNTKIRSNIQYGQSLSTEVGPAMTWDKAYFKHHALEPASFDRAETAVENTGTKELIFPFSPDYETDISTTNADSVLSLKLHYYTKDSIGVTPAQLSNWHVLFAPAPELAINPTIGQYVPTTAINIGSDLKFGLAIENVSTYGMGDFRVRYWLINNKREVEVEKWLDYDTLAPGDILFDTVSFATETFAGDYTIWMEVNPEDSLWHKEQYHFNNTAFKAFETTADNRNPLLDVTFDGIHILNGDIVAPSPEIVMQLKDENPLLLLTDTSTFEVFLTLPNGTQARVPFFVNGLENMIFEPAANTQNKARLTWLPDNLADGKYSLSVIAKDASGNLSGNTSYKIDFEVVNRSTVSSVMNYPNPFTTSTRFVFTLTGSQVPDVFTIQILSVTGKVVREITKLELGDLHIGRNITDYAWDGTDEFGDRLANGVYLYRVIMKIAGEKIEHRESGADEYFTQEFGKMYLFR